MHKIIIIVTSSYEYFTEVVLAGGTGRAILLVAREGRGIGCLVPAIEMD